jgi:hypothetical protein
MVEGGDDITYDWDIVGPWFLVEYELGDGIKHGYRLG